MAEYHALRRVAERAATQPFYLAASLLAYARAEGLDDAGLAEQLGCELAQLPSLLLCRRPTGEGLVFRKDVEAIAQRFGLEAMRLARLVRAADALVALQQSAGEQADGAGPRQFLAAARDRSETDRPGRDRSETDRPQPDRPVDGGAISRDTSESASPDSQETDR